MIGTLISTMAASVANTALPTIELDFGVSAGAVVWVVNGTQIATTATLLFFASLCDARGARRIYLIGLVVFVLASLGCALAPTFAILVAARVVQGLGLSALIVGTNPLTRAMYEPHQIGRSISINATFVAIGTAAGPTVGGLILAVASWHWIFWLNFGVGLISIALGLRYVPRVPAGGGPIDPFSAVLAAAGIGSFIYTLDAVARREPFLEIVVIGIFSAIVLFLFIRRQLRMDEPMIAIELFRKRIFSVAVVVSCSTYAAQSIAFVTLPFFFQSVLGRTPLESGLLLLAWPLASLLIAPRMGPISDRYPAVFLTGLGISILGVGLLLFALLPALPATIAIVGCAAVCGAGFAIFQTPNARSLIAAAPAEKTGRATGIMSTARLFGQTVGAATVAIVFEVVATATGGVPARPAIEAGLFVALGFIAFAILLSLWRVRLRQTVVSGSAATTR